MDSTTTATLLYNAGGLLEKQDKKIPRQFVWPAADRRPDTLEELQAPVVDLAGFLGGDEESTRRAAELVRAACLSHGFFRVANHGVSPPLSLAALGCVDEFFHLPPDRKLRSQKRPGSIWGYAGAHADRFSSSRPWKETLSVGYHEGGGGDEPRLVDYFVSVLGEDFERMGWVFETYCRAMKRLALAIMELLAISLGVDRAWYRDFFDDGYGIMRCNYYPPCQEPDLALGTGPHCDPTALTLLQQDQVGGLEVFAEGKWQSISPERGTFVVNIGDTFVAMSNGKYKSCLHRAVVNRHRERKSMAFFLCPRGDRVVKPPPELLGGDGRLLYPEFRWRDLLEYTQRQYRADTKTLQSFTRWLLSSSPPLQTS